MVRSALQGKEQGIQIAGAAVQQFTLLRRHGGHGRPQREQLLN